MEASGALSRDVLMDKGAVGKAVGSWKETDVGLSGGTVLGPVLFCYIQP